MKVKVAFYFKIITYVFSGKTARYKLYSAFVAIGEKIDFNGVVR